MDGASYKLTFEDRGTYLYVHITGLDSFAASLSYWNEIADEVGRLGFKKLLIHEGLVGSVNEGEMFDIIMDLIGSSLVGVKIAFYDENNDDAPVNALGQLIANNRGGTVRLFRNLDAAKKWIEKNEI